MDLESELAWIDQNAEGRLLAEKTVCRIRERGLPILLGPVAKEIVTRSRYGGFEVGFFHAIALELILQERVAARIGLPGRGIAG